MPMMRENPTEQEMANSDPPIRQTAGSADKEGGGASEPAQVGQQVAAVMAIEEGETQEKTDGARLRHHTAFDKGKDLITAVMTKNRLF